MVSQENRVLVLGVVQAEAASGPKPPSLPTLEDPEAGAPTLLTCCLRTSGRDPGSEATLLPICLLLLETGWFSCGQLQRGAAPDSFSEFHVPSCELVYLVESGGLIKIMGL